MRQIGLAIILSMLCFFQSFSQESYSVRALAMASSSLANSLHSNPAELTMHNNNNIAFSTENRFLESKLSYYNLYGDLHGKEIDLAVLFSYFGYSDYNDFSVKLTLARSFSPRVAAGLGLKLKTHQHINADRNTYLGVIPGFLFSLPYEQKIGVNLCAEFLANGESDQNSDITGNISYGITFDNHFFTIGCDYNHNDEFEGKAGYEATISKQLKIRCGLTFPEPTPSFGLGTSLGMIDLDASYSFHTHLRGIFGLSLTANIYKR